MNKTHILTTFIMILYIGFSGVLLGDTEGDLQAKDDFMRNITQPEMSEITETIKQHDEDLVVFSNLNLQVGESGIIMRDLSSYKVIVASAVITKVEHTKTFAKVIPFTQLVQPYLPTPNMTPQVGDQVIFRSFNNKAFIIAPNEKSYKAISEKYPFIEFVSSDLLMGFLNSQGKHDPTNKTLPKACNEYGVGLVFIIGSKEMGIFSCQNMARLAKYPNELTDKSTKSPFYTRTNFEGGGSLTYSLASKKSREYFLYYDSFMK